MGQDGFGQQDGFGAGAGGASSGAPPVVSEGFSLSDGATQVILSQAPVPSANLNLYINGLRLRRGEHFAVSGRLVSLSLDYPISDTDFLDAQYTTTN